MNLLSTLFSIAARLVLAVASIVLFLAVLAAGLVIFAVVLLWDYVGPRLQWRQQLRAARLRAARQRPQAPDPHGPLARD